MGAMLNLQGMLFLLLLVGVIARKCNVITMEGRKCLSSLIIKVILPCNIIHSFCIEWSMRILKQCGMVLLVAIFAQLFYLVLSKILYRQIPKEKSIILQYATICSNAGFMGNPIVEAVYGSTGLLFASVALIPLRISMWSAGLSLFTRTEGKNVVKSLLTHPCIVAVYIGFFLLFTQMPLPGFLDTAIQSIGGCNTGISMIVIGAILAEIDIQEIMDIRLLYYSFIRLLAIPLAVFGVMQLFHMEPLIIGVTVLLAAMPAGSTTVLLADTYGKDSRFASSCVFVSTILSMITLPVISIIL